MTISLKASLAELLAVLAPGSISACTIHATAEPAAAPPPAPAPAQAAEPAPAPAPPPPQPAAPAPPPPPAVVTAPAPPPPERHPAYLHALSDLREARANLEHWGGDAQLKWDERGAVEAIDRAIGDIKRAAIDDGKNLQDHPAIDAHEPRAGRLHRALAALRTARADVSKEEDNAFASGLRARGLHNIDEAVRFTEQGIAEADRLAAVPPPPPVVAAAPPAPAAHPSYLHALTDLRSARAHLERRGGDAQVKWDEHNAIELIDRAIHDIKQAAIDDGKNLDDHPPVDVKEPRAGRLHKALAALRAARDDVAKEEDNAFANGLRARGLHNIDEAIRVTEQGIADAEHRM